MKEVEKESAEEFLEKGVQQFPYQRQEQNTEFVPAEAEPKKQRPALQTAIK
jgi:hypothetical protein